MAGNSPENNTKNNKRCPFLDTPREECYSSQMSSQTAEATLKYCGGDFQSCHIYKKYRAELGPDFGR